MALEEKLSRLESILQKHHAPVLQQLQPGRKKEELVAFFEAHGIRPHADLLRLYTWHNGVKDLYCGSDSVLDLLPMGKFFNLDDLLRMQADFVEWNYLETGDPKELVPLFGSGEDDMYLLNTSSGSVYKLSPAANVYGALAFSSLDEMFGFILECYDEKIFSIDPEEGLLFDSDKYFAKMPG